MHCEYGSSCLCAEFKSRRAREAGMRMAVLACGQQVCPGHQIRGLCFEWRMSGWHLGSHGVHAGPRFFCALARRRIVRGEIVAPRPTAEVGIAAADGVRDPPATPCSERPMIAVEPPQPDTSASWHGWADTSLPERTARVEEVAPSGRLYPSHNAPADQTLFWSSWGVGVVPGSSSASSRR